MINKLVNFINSTQSTIYDTESLTILESIGKIIEKVNNCINEFNNLEIKTTNDYNNFLNQIKEYKEYCINLIESYYNNVNATIEEFKRLIELLNGIDEVVKYVQSQSDFVQEIAKKNQNEIDKGTIATQDQIKDINQNIAVIKSLYVTPEDYGAIGDGKTDDYQAFFNMIKTINNKDVEVILNKNYYIGSSLDFSDIVFKGIRFIGKCNGSEKSKIIYGGTNWLFNLDTVNSVIFENILFMGNDSNYGINFGDTTNYNIKIKNCIFNNFVRNIYFGRTAYVNIEKCTLWANTHTEYLLTIGSDEKRSYNELFTCCDTQFVGGESLTATGDLIRINSASTFRFVRCDLANILGKSLLISNNTQSPIFDVIFDSCQFTRAKEGIKFEVPVSSSVRSVVFKNCAWSLHGGWADGEKNLIEISGIGSIIEGLNIDNATLTLINNTNIPEYFVKCENNHHKINISILFAQVELLNLKNSNHSLISDHYIGLLENGISNNGFKMEKMKNKVYINGALNFTTSFNSYTNLMNDIPDIISPLYDANTPLQGVDDNGNIYSFFIENGTLKCRNDIQENTIIRFNTFYLAK